MFDHYRIVEDTPRLRTYRISDTDFIDYITIPNRFDDGGDLQGAVVAVIKIYSVHDRPILPNIVRAYLWDYKRYAIVHTLESLLKAIELDRKVIDLEFPELEYGRKYYSCVIRQIIKNNYIKGTR